MILHFFLCTSFCLCWSQSSNWSTLSSSYDFLATDFFMSFGGQFLNNRCFLKNSCFPSSADWSPNTTCHFKSKHMYSVLPTQQLVHLLTITSFVILNSWCPISEKFKFNSPIYWNTSVITDILVTVWNLINCKLPLSTTKLRRGGSLKSWGRLNSELLKEVEKKEVLHCMAYTENHCDCYGPHFHSWNAKVGCNSCTLTIIESLL